MARLCFLKIRTNYYCWRSNMSIRCAMAGCSAEAFQGGNYCSIHQPVGNGVLRVNSDPDDPEEFGWTYSKNIMDKPGSDICLDELVDEDVEAENSD